VVSEDKAVGISGFADGSFQKIDFFADGAISSPEEPVEVFLAAHVLKLSSCRKADRVCWVWVQRDGSLAARRGIEGLYSTFL